MGETVAGTNKILKSGQILFKAGDQSDGMYLIRKGELQVYLEQNGHETLLAKVGSGGLIGEMALFDNSLRSASVKAISECEVTHISLEDFAKLMKQIPKWFVSLMSALSGRLRSTNERLQKLESGSNTGNSLALNSHTLARYLNLLLIIWAKDGVKEGKEQVLGKAHIEHALIEIFAEDAERVRKMFEILSEHKITTSRQDQRRQIVLVASNRSVLQQLPIFLQKFRKAHYQLASFPDSALNLLRTLEKMMLASPYETLTIALQDLEKEAAIAGYSTETWLSDIELFKTSWEEVKSVRAASGPGLKTNKKDISTFVRLHELLAAFHKAKLL